MTGTLNVIQACLNEGVAKVVHASTSEAYGTAVYTPINENHPLRGQSPYSATKIGADKLAEKVNHLFEHRDHAHEFGTFNRKKVETELTLLVIAEQIQAIYKEVLNRD